MYCTRSHAICAHAMLFRTKSAFPRAAISSFEIQGSSIVAPKLSRGRALASFGIDSSFCISMLARSTDCDFDLPMILLDGLRTVMVPLRCHLTKFSAEIGLYSPSMQNM